MSKMNAELKQAWITALRSGDYKQARNTLYHRDEATGKEKHCCLGVLCEVKIERGDTSIVKVIGEAGEESMIMTVGSDKEGLRNTSDLLPELNINKISTCIYRNDNEERTFEQIADWLEEMKEF